MSQTNARNRIAIVGTGHRGTTMWGSDLISGWRGEVDIVGLCDTNSLRAHAAQREIGTNAPVYTDLDRLIAEVKPDSIIVTSRDDTHDTIIIKALEAGIRVISEKPMTTTPEKCRAILEAEKRTGGTVDVTFNYRFAPTARRIKEILASGEIGDVTSVDFHWYLDTRHGADYFRRWHAFEEFSSSLFVHKATHHFDLLNWYLGSEPEWVMATGDLRIYGRNGPFRSERCTGCAHAPKCDFYWDYARDLHLANLYDGPSREDGYHRDGCVYREDIDIYDTMAATIRFRNGVSASYSLNAAMPMEGHHLAFNGTKGRIEIRQHENFPFAKPEGDEILVMPNFRKARIEPVPHQPGGHFGGDDRLRNLLFGVTTEDPFGQRASARAGAIAMLTGYAALASAKDGRLVTISELGGLPPD